MPSHTLLDMWLLNHAVIKVYPILSKGAPDDIFNYIFLYEMCVVIQIELDCVPKGSINNTPSLVQIVSWCRIHV